MPELPEVETVRRGLAPVLTGARLARVLVRRDGLRWPFPPRMAERLEGAGVTALRRRSKYILADLDRGETLLIHLGMSGRIRIDDAVTGAVPGQFVHSAGAVETHDHVVIWTDAGARITFNDARRFGCLDLFDTATEDHMLLRRLGPEPLGNGFDAVYLAERMAGRQTPVKALLLDQGAVAGLGNIYVCESLWRAGISPKRLAGSISRQRIARLVPAIRDVLTEAIAAGGSSLRDHRQTDGALGYFQHSFAVYGREGEACHRDGCGGRIVRIVQSARSSFYCPRCQR